MVDIGAPDKLVPDLPRNASTPCASMAAKVHSVYSRSAVVLLGQHIAARRVSAWQTWTYKPQNARTVFKPSP